MNEWIDNEKWINKSLEWKEKKLLIARVVCKSLHHHHRVIDGIFEYIFYVFF